MKKIDALGGVDKYIKALEDLYKKAREIEKAKVPYHYQETFNRQSNETMTAESNSLVVPLYDNISYKKTREDWYRRLLGYIEAMKQSDLSEEEPPPPPKKVKKITINGVHRSFKEGKIDGHNVLIIYKETDEKLEHPLGYYKWDMDKNRPSGKLLPMP